MREGSVELTVDIVVHGVTVQVDRGLGGPLGGPGEPWVTPVQPAQVEDDDQEEAGDAQADTEGQHQHQHPLVGLEHVTSEE